MLGTQSPTQQGNTLIHASRPRPVRARRASSSTLGRLPRGVGERAAVRSGLTVTVFCTPTPTARACACGGVVEPEVLIWWLVERRRPWHLIVHASFCDPNGRCTGSPMTSASRHSPRPNRGVEKAAPESPALRERSPRSTAPSREQSMHPAAARPHSSSGHHSSEPVTSQRADGVNKYNVGKHRSASPRISSSAPATSSRPAPAQTPPETTAPPATAAPPATSQHLDSCTYYEYIAAHTNSIPVVEPQASTGPQTSLHKPARSTSTRRRVWLTIWGVVLLLALITVSALLFSSVTQTPDDDMRPANEQQLGGVEPASAAPTPASR